MREIHVPRPAQPGDVLGVVAPSGPVDPARLRAGVRALEALGFGVALGEHLGDRRGHLAGTDADRAQDLSDMFARPDVAGIVCARGGAGSARLLLHLDLDALAGSRKAFVGYSDVTVLHLALQRHGLATFYGPMVASDLADGLSPAALTTFSAALAGEWPGRVISDAQRPARTLVPGRAAGRLTGGTLCLVQDTLATPWALRPEGAILLLEDYHCPLWRVDRMLVHLKLAGILDAAAGFVFGPLYGGPSDPDSLSAEQLLEEIVRPLGKPAIYDFPVGHLDSPLTLPLGVPVELDADAGSLRFGL